MSETVTCGSLAGTVDPATGAECEACTPLEGHLSTYYWVCVDMEEATPEVCPFCGALLSFDAEGQPTARAQVPKPAGTQQYGATVVKVLPSSPDGSKHCEIVVDSSRVELCPNAEMIVVVRQPATTEEAAKC